MGRVASDGGDLVGRVAASAADLGAPGGAPRSLRRAFTLGPPLHPMAGHPELAAAHEGWVELTGARRAPVSGMRARVARLVVGVIRSHPEYRHQRDLLAQLTRVVDALAKRCDELEQRLQVVHDEVEDIAAVLSEDLTRLTALLASRQDPRDAPADG